MKPSLKFNKGERLKRKKIIGRLFNREGLSFSIFPLRIIWLKTELDSPYPVQFALSVPKRAFPKAAHRNRVRRQLREVYRLNKPDLYNGIRDQDQYAIMLLYVGKKEPSFEELDHKLKVIIKKFKRKIQETQ